jgi:hypothetical protein
VSAQQAAALQGRQIAMNEPGACRRRRGGEIALLEQHHPQAAAGGIARQAHAIEPTADDREIVIRHTQDRVQRIEAPYT